MSKGHLFISDDVFIIHKKGNKLIGSNLKKDGFYSEIKDIGIFNLKEIFGKNSLKTFTEIFIEFKLISDEKRKLISGAVINKKSKKDILGKKIDYFELITNKKRGLDVIIELTVQKYINENS